MFGSITSRVVAITDTVLCRIGDVVLPVCDLIQRCKADFLVAFGVIVAMFALGIILFKFHAKDIEKNFDRYVEKIPSSIFYAVIVMKVFYPVTVAWYGMMLGLAGFGGVGVETGLFSGFSEWVSRDQFLVVIAMMQLLVTSAVCVIRLKPFSLLRYWIYTIDYALIGYVVSCILFLLRNIAGNFLPAQLLVMVLFFILYTGLPVIFIIVAFAPVYSMIALILSPIIGLINGFNFDIEMENGDVYRCNFLLLLTDMMLP